MTKSNVRNLKKEINEKNIKKIYYFTGQNYFLMENFTEKIFESINKNYKNSLDYLFIENENVDLNKVGEYVETFPMSSYKKCILMNIANMNNMKKEFYDLLLNILSSIPDFCVFIVHDISNDSYNKNIYYNNFLKKVVEISEFCEFKCDSTSSQKQAILWAKGIGKNLSQENSYFLCEKCMNNMDLVKKLVENICLSCRDKEISHDLIEKFSPKFSYQYNIYDISKSIRNNDLVSAMKISNCLLQEGEEAMRIFSIIKSDFLDALRVKEGQKQGISFSEISKIFKYQGKEFKLKYAEILCRKYHIDKIISFIYKSDANIKSLPVSTITILQNLFVILKKYQI